MAGVDLSGASSGASEVAVDVAVLTSTQLTATFPVSTAVTAGLFVSSTGSNTPSPDVGNVASYVDPNPETGGVTPGTGSTLPNNGNQRQPFLRAQLSLISRSFGYNGNRSLSWTYPSDAQVGDVVVLALQGLTSGQTVPDGWVELNQTNGAHVWAHYLIEGEAGTTVTQFVIGYSSLLGVGGIWGNATLDTVLANTVHTANSLTAPEMEATAGECVAFMWLPSMGYTTAQMTWSGPSYLANLQTTKAAQDSYYWPAFANVYPISDTFYAPTLTATGPASFGNTTNFSIRLKGITVFSYAEIALEEAIGSGDTVDLDSYVHLLAVDEHSPQDAYGYAQGTMNDTNSGTAYTYERWVRVRFTPQFNSVRDFRVWAPNLVDIPTGWSVNFGTASAFQTPVNTASSIAVNPMPTSDPGRESPNAGGETPLAGTGTQYSDWIVLQASADTAVVGPGPVLGFSTEGTLIPIQFAFTWIET